MADFFRLGHDGRWGMGMGMGMGSGYSFANPMSGYYHQMSPMSSQFMSHSMGYMGASMAGMQSNLSQPHSAFSLGSNSTNVSNGLTNSMVSQEKVKWGKIQFYIFFSEFLTNKAGGGCSEVKKNI